MKYKFTKKFQAELRPLFEAGANPGFIAYELYEEHCYAKALELAVSALGSLYISKGDDA